MKLRQITFTEFILYLERERKFDKHPQQLTFKLIKKQQNTNKLHPKEYIYVVYPLCQKLIMI